MIIISLHIQVFVFLPNHLSEYRINLRTIDCHIKAKNFHSHNISSMFTSSHAKSNDQSSSSSSDIETTFLRPDSADEDPNTDFPDASPHNKRNSNTDEIEEHIICSWFCPVPRRKYLVRQNTYYLFLPFSSSELQTIRHLIMFRIWKEMIQKISMTLELALIHIVLC